MHVAYMYSCARTQLRGKGKGGGLSCHLGAVAGDPLASTGRCVVCRSAQHTNHRRRHHHCRHCHHHFQHYRPPSHSPPAHTHRRPVGHLHVVLAIAIALPWLGPASRVARCSLLPHRTQALVCEFQSCQHLVRALLKLWAELRRWSHRRRVARLHINELLMGIDQNLRRTSRLA